MPEPVIVAAARSPIGRAAKGRLVQLRADDMLAQIVAAALGQVPELADEPIDDLMAGCALPGGEQGFNLARVVAVMLGRDDVPGVTVNRFCASSLQTIRMAAHAIRAGEGDLFIACGVEQVSRSLPDSPEHGNPRFGRTPPRTGPWSDPRERGHLPDVYMSMGETAENVAKLYGVTRAEMDEFALHSQRKAAAAAAAGFWKTDIQPIRLPDGSVVAEDDSPRPTTTLEALQALSPVFSEDGTVTAGNACPVNDGAAALVVMSDTRAAELGITPLARIVATATSALSPEIMGLGPVEASRRALKRAGLEISDIDQVELNEAFAAQAIPCQRELGVPDEKLNVNGGAIALGHPYGMTGARIATTLIHSLQAHDETLGLETMCVAGGMGMAMVLERLS